MSSSVNDHRSSHLEGGVIISPEEFMIMNNNDTSNTGQSTDTLVSNVQLFYVEMIVFVLAGGCVSVFGILTNIVNVIVFIRQGVFTDSGTASLLGLAVADLLSVAFMLWMCVTYSYVLADPPGLSWGPWDMWYLTACWPHLMFTQIARMITAYIAFERCFCVVFPFKVKSIFTPRRSIIIIISMFLIFGFGHSPLYVAQQLKFRHDPAANRTRLLLVSAPSWQQTVDIMWYINSLTFNLGSVAVVLVCTIVTASRVKLSKAWRESMTTGTTSSKPEHSQVPNNSSNDNKNKNNKKCGAVDARRSSMEEVHQSCETSKKQETTVQHNQMSRSRLQREKTLVRMITAISVIFLLSFTPDLTFLLMFSSHHEIRLGRQYHNLAMTMYSFTFLMETLNSSINIIVYYKMSSKYKQELNRLFGWEKDEK